MEEVCPHLNLSPTYPFTTIYLGTFLTPWRKKKYISNAQTTNYKEEEIYFFSGLKMTK